MYERMYLSACIFLGGGGREYLRKLFIMFSETESLTGSGLADSITLADTSEAPESHLSLSPELASAHSHAWLFRIDSGTELRFSGLLFSYYLPCPQVPEMISLSLGLNRSVGIFPVLVLRNW